VEVYVHPATNQTAFALRPLQQYNVDKTIFVTRLGDGTATVN
jgi:hypothetical protein